MKTKKKWWYRGILVIAIIGIAMYLNSKLSALDPLIVYDEITFEEINKSIYFRGMAWGLAGNHEEVILSENKIKPNDRKSIRNRDLIFYTSELYYKKTGLDSLIIYVKQSSIPSWNNTQSFKPVKITVNPLKYSSDLKRFENTYKDNGYEKISIYD